MSILQSRIFTHIHKNYRECDLRKTVIVIAVIGIKIKVVVKQGENCYHLKRSLCNCSLLYSDPTFTVGFLSTISPFASRL